VKYDGHVRVTSLLTAFTVATLAAQPALKPGVDATTFDRTVRPQDDLFTHVNAAWSAATEIPDDRVFYGAFQEVGAKVERDLHAIVLDVVANPDRWRPDGRKIADLYESIMDEARIERAGLDPARPQLARIEAIETPSQLAEEAGRLSANGDGGLFDGVIGGDPRNPGNLAVQLTQGGTLLPDRDHYLRAEPRYVRIRAAYEAYLSQIFSLAGRAEAADQARALVAFETELAKAHWTVAETRDPDRADARYRLEQLRAEMPGFDWTAWARPQGLDRGAAIVLGQPSFFQAFASIVARTPLRTLKAWLSARYLTAVAPYACRALADARFEFFGRVLTGQQSPTARWRRGVSLVNGFLGDAIGRLYVERHFPPASKRRVERLVETIVAAYHDAVEGAPWLSPRAKAEARRKLDGLVIRIGYPDAWRNYRNLEVRRDDLVGNVERGRRFDGAMRLGRQRDLVDPRLWLIAPQTVNAYYSPGTNEIVVPAAILQPPFFDPGAEDAVNYGAIGAIVGHEIGHALDDRGRFFDASGRTRDWWAREDAEAYVARAQVLVDQFGRYEAAPGARVDGMRTLRENAGDLGGLSVAYAAYRRSLGDRPPPAIDGLTAGQRFFVAYARMWRSKEREAYLRQWVVTVPHAPSIFRVNGVVSHVPGFYEAFGVGPGDRLYREPAARVRIW
jgi:predicted metalloendopeptidase